MSPEDDFGIEETVEIYDAEITKLEAEVARLRKALEGLTAASKNWRSCAGESFCRCCECAMLAALEGKDG